MIKQSVCIVMGFHRLICLSKINKMNGKECQNETQMHETSRAYVYITASQLRIWQSQFKYPTEMHLFVFEGTSLRQT